MGKYIRGLTKTKQDELFIRFAQGLASLKNSVETANFIRDLLSEPEIIMLARRLQIAELLINGLTYDDIQASIRTSKNTIARVQTWLNLYGEGYRTVLKRTKPEPSPSPESSSWRAMKRKHSMYFWPE